MAKILVVDDDPHLLLLYWQEFTDDGHLVLCATNGRQGLRIAREKRPDVIILDLAMPEMDGIETLEKLEASESTIPVILNTAFLMCNHDYKLWAVDACLLKSSDLGELKSKVEELLLQKSHAHKGRSEHESRRDVHGQGSDVLPGHELVRCGVEDVGGRLWNPARDRAVGEADRGDHGS